MFLASRFFSVCAAALMAVFVPALHADVIDNFNLNATLVGGGTVQGTDTIDISTGAVTGADFTAGPIIPPDLTYTFDGPPYSQGVNGSAAYAAFVTTGGYDIFNLFVPGASFAGYAGGSICSDSAFCTDAYGYKVEASDFVFVGDPSGIPNGNGENVISGTLTLANAPEPSSVLLLGTGLVGLMGAMRRRFAASS